MITQGTGASSINESLARNLTRQPWAEHVSPEILSLGTIAGEPVLIRGADPFTFVEIERGEWIDATTVRDEWAFAGEGLALRIGISTGTYVSLVGSTIARIDVARIRGIFRTATPANDELIVDFARARFLTGVGLEGYHSIRVQTSDVTALLAFLESFGASVHVSGPDVLRTDVDSDAPADARLVNLILRTGLGGAPKDYLAAAVSDATHSVRVAALGIASLIGLLIALGIHAVQARAFADKRAAVGILRAVGATNGWMRRRVLRETLPRAVAAGAIGASLGLSLEPFLRPAGGLVVFGHTVVPAFSVLTFAAIIVVVAGASVISSLVLLQSALRERPGESIHERTADRPLESLEVVLRG